MLLGTERVTEADVVSHRDCALGKWFYGAGKRTCGKFPEYSHLGKVHEEMHDTVKKAVRFWNEGKMEEAQAAGERVYQLSEEVIRLIDELDECHQRVRQESNAVDQEYQISAN